MADLTKSRANGSRKGKGGPPEYQTALRPPALGTLLARSAPVAIDLTTEGDLYAVVDRRNREEHQ
jgi:hypothetical protein